VSFLISFVRLREVSSEGFPLRRKGKATGAVGEIGKSFIEICQFLILDLNFFSLSKPIYGSPEIFAE